MDSYLELAYLLGCPRRAPHLDLATLREDEAAADDVWRRLRLPRAKKWWSATTQEDGEVGHLPRHGPMHILQSWHTALQHVWERVSLCSVVLKNGLQPQILLYVLPTRRSKALQTRL